MKRIEILREAKRLLKKSRSGICFNVYLILEQHGIFKPSEQIFPLLDLRYAEKFRKPKDHNNNYGGFWWKPGEFGLFSGRRRYFRWLMKQYKNDKTEICP